MTVEFTPALILILGALPLPFLGLAWRRTWLLLLPLIGLWQVLNLDAGMSQAFPFMGYQVELLRVDALALDCMPEVEHARKIVTSGTSAHRQLAVYHEKLGEGVEKLDALKAVVDQLIEETISGLD